MEVLMAINTASWIVGILLGGIIGLAVSILVGLAISKIRLKEAEKDIQGRIETARREAETILKKPGWMPPVSLSASGKSYQ